MKRYLETIKSEEAVRRILEHIRPIEDEELIPTYQSKGRITTRPVTAKYSNPPFVCSAMDGYSTMFEKTLEADTIRPVSLKKGSDAVRVNTGDAVSDGMNAVVIREDVEESDEYIVIRKPLYLWQNVRMIGEDIIEGDMLLPTNHVMGIFDVSMLISADVTHVHVRRMPKILIIPTGKELIDIYERSPDTKNHEKGLIDFNSHLLAEMAAETGFQAERHAIIADRKELRDVVDRSIGDYDVLLINAGSSAGDEDYTEDIIRELGTLVFHGVSMMPGRPAIFGIVHNKPVFGIPGYPVSAAVSFQTFLEPVHERLTSSRIQKRSVPCLTPYKIPSRIGMEEIVRVNLQQHHGRYYVFPLPRGASIFSSMARADGLMRIPENIEGYGEDEEIQCRLLKDEGDIANRIHIVGSHDLSLDIMRDLLKKAHPEADLLSTHTGSLSGILAVKKGVANLCTTHILDDQENVYNIPVIEKYLAGMNVILMHIAKRQQGLVVQKGNPKNITGIEDLGREDVKFINRQFGSGTRILVDLLLKEKGVSKGSIRGYEREESSHTAVGIAVRESVADAGVAIYAVAKIFSLGFIPLAEEEYDLVVTGSFAKDQRFIRLMEIIRSDIFRKRLEDIGGYNTEHTGTVKYGKL
jgi:putative molybdopterin biosynthesis protein